LLRSTVLQVIIGLLRSARVKPGTKNFLYDGFKLLPNTLAESCVHHLFLRNVWLCPSGDHRVAALSNGQGGRQELPD
jgi:hypothetical protein